MNRRRNPVALVIAFVFIDLLGYSLFLPLLPYYAETLGATPTLVGLLIASNAVAQLAAAPVVGRLSDRLGRRPLLIFSIFGTLVSFLLLGLVEPLGALLSRVTSEGIAVGSAALAMLFFSRILDGLAGGNISLARAYITDVTDEKNRAKGLGLIGAAFGMGFIIGPAMGGTLSNWDYATSAFAAIGLSRYAVPAFVAVGLSALNLLGVILWLPESLPPEKRALMASSPRTAFTARCLWECLHRPRFGALLHTRFFYMLAFTTFTANFALYTRYRLGLTDQATSYILAYVGLLVVLVQGFAIGRLTARFSETRLIFGAVALMAVMLLAWAFVPGVPLLLVVLAPLALVSGVLNTVTNSAITKSVYAEEVGGVLGLSASLDSLTRVIAPAIGGILLEQLGAWALGLFGALILAWVLLYVWRWLIAHPAPPLPGRGEEMSPESVQR
jgi:DHA1 family tetracycline resistance protein-like MFS transporter